MNRIYKTVWNKTHGQFVVAAEVAHSRGAGTGVRRATIAVAVGAILGVLGAAPAAHAATQTAAGGTIKVQDNDGAATVSGNRGTAVGSGSKTSGNQSVAVGSKVQATGDQSTALGNDTLAMGDSSIAIGGDDFDRIEGISGTNRYGATINGTTYNNQTGNFLYNKLTGANLFDDGQYAKAAAGDSSIALGTQAEAGVTLNGAAKDGVFDIAIGTKAKARGFSSTAIGTHAQALGDASFAIGANALAQGNDATAFGSGASAIGDSSFAMGHLSKASNEGTIAFGAGANASAQNTISFGFGSQANQQNAVAFGANAKATAADAMAFGPGAIADGNKAIAIGPGSHATASHDGTLVDFSTVGGHSGNIAGAIGANAGVVSFGQDIQYETNPDGSVKRDGNGIPIIAAGGAGVQRQLQNVAPGRISDTSTDAVNGSQLNVTNQQVASNTQSINNASKNAPVVYTDTGGNKLAKAGDGNWYPASSVNPDGSLIGTPAAVPAASVIASMQNANGSATAPTMLTNVAAGTIGAGSTDAINGGQLFSAIADARTHYYSVNDGGTPGGNFNNDGATGANSLAAGVGAIAKGTGNVSIGYNAATTVGNDSVAIGNEAAALGSAAVSIGHQAGQIDTTAQATFDSALVAIGDQAGFGAMTGIDGGVRTGGVSSGVFVGQRAGLKAQGYRNTFVGANTGLSSGAPKTFSEVLPSLPNDAITGASRGSDNVNDPGHNVGLGDEAYTNATGNWNTAVGTASLSGANGDRNTAQGFYSGFKTQGDDNVAIGYMAGVIPGATAAATPTTVNANRTVSIGRNSLANGDDAVAMGSSALANSANDIAIGNGAQATGGSSIAIGTGNVVSGANSGAFGDPNTISGADSYAFGNNNTIANNNAFVVGSGVSTTQDNSVVLGNASTDRAATTEASSTVTTSGGTTITFGPYAGQGSATNGVVSMGAAGKERQLINVAAGQVSSNSTDAINGSQLFATNTAVGNVAQSVASGMGGTSAVNPDGTVTTGLSVGGTNYTSVNSALQALNTTATAGWNFTLNGGPAQNIPSGGTIGLQQGSNIELTQSGGVVTVATSATPTFTSVTTGSGANQTVLGGVNGGVTIGAAGPTQVALTNGGLNNGGNQITNVASGGTTTTNAANIGDVQSAVAGATYGAQQAAPVVYTDATGTKLAKANDGKWYPAANVKPDGSINGAPTAVPAANVLASMQNPDGTATTPTVLANVAPGALNATSTQAVNGSQLYGTNQTVQNLGSSVASGLGGTSSYDPSTGQVTTGLVVGGTSYGSVNEALNGISVTAGAGWNVTTGVAAGTSGVANGSSVANVGPNGTHTIEAGNNIITTQNGTSVAIGVNPDLKGLNSVSIVGGPTLNSAGINMNNTKVTNLAPGTAPTEAVNLGQMPMQYSTAASPTIPNPAAPSNDVTLVGGNTSQPVALHNVAAGTAGTDAANVGQVMGAAQQAQSNAQNYTDQRINGVYGAITDVGRRADAGVAGAMAAASLPQPYRPGQSMIGAALGGYHGQAGIAVGVSTISDNGSWVFKANVSGNTSGNVGVGVGAGFVW